MSAVGVQPGPKPQPLEPQQWRQLALITVAAVATFFGLRLLPTGTNLSHMDFRVDPKAGNAIEFCDPANPQFIPVVTARSPVTMNVVAAEPATVRREVRAVVMLKTGGGKAVGPEDLLVTHTRRLHLLIVDSELRDYQHVHPEPTRTPGEWSFIFTPQTTGRYRVFGDFTPAATGRGLYASADLDVAEPRTGEVGGQPVEASGQTAPRNRHSPATVERGGYSFALAAAQSPALAGQLLDLRFAVERVDGGVVPLQPVMGAFAHLVAFDAGRTGFAHLHPTETDLAKTPDLKQPALNFKLTIPTPGRYVIWAQVNLGGAEEFIPFPLDVAP